jgi:predicted ester cyclase
MNDAERVFRRLVDEVINGGQLSAIDELVAKDYVDHTGGEGGPAGYRETIEFVQAAFSGMHMTIHDVLGVGDRVAVRFSVEATHTGEFMGLAATGKQVTWEGISIIRVADGKMAERWNVSDMLGLLEQIRGET